MGFTEYHSFSIQVFDRKQRVWRVTWDHEYEDYKGRGHGTLYVRDHESFFFADHQSEQWESNPDTFPIVDDDRLVISWGDTQQANCTTTEYGYLSITETTQLKPWQHIAPHYTSMDKCHVERFYQDIQGFLAVARIQLYTLPGSHSFAQNCPEANNGPRNWDMPLEIDYDTDEEENEESSASASLAAMERTLALECTSAVSNCCYASGCLRT